MPRKKKPAKKPRRAPSPREAAKQLLTAGKKSRAYGLPAPVRELVAIVLEGNRNGHDVPLQDVHQQAQQLYSYPRGYEMFRRAVYSEFDLRTWPKGGA